MSSPGETNQRDEGRFDALLFLQSLDDHGAVMTADETGKVLAGELMDLAFEAVGEVVAEVRRRGAEAQPEAMQVRLVGFAELLGEVLWQRAADRREDAQRGRCNVVTFPRGGGG